MYGQSHEYQEEETAASIEDIPGSDFVSASHIGFPLSVRVHVIMSNTPEWATIGELGALTLVSRAGV